MGLGSMPADCLQPDLRFLFEKPSMVVAKASWNTHAASEEDFH